MGEYVMQTIASLVQQIHRTRRHPQLRRLHQRLKKRFRRRMRAIRRELADARTTQ